MKIIYFSHNATRETRIVLLVLLACGLALAVPSSCLLDARCEQIVAFSGHLFLFINIQF